MISIPTDISLPPESAYWLPDTVERFIERICLWSDGNAVTDQIYQDSRQAAWSEEGEWNKP